MPDKKIVGQRLKTLRGSRTLEEVGEALGKEAREYQATQ